MKFVRAVSHLSVILALSLLGTAAEQRDSGLSSLPAAAQSAVSAQAVVDHVRKQLIGVLGLRDCRFEYGILIGHPPRLEQDGTIVTRYGHIDVELAGMPAEEVELRTFGNGQYYGRFMVTPTPGSKPTRQARLVAVTLADLAGRALGSAVSSRA